MQNSAPQQRESFRPSSSPSLDHTRYYTHKEINAYLDWLAANNNWVTTESIGTTWENRDMKVLQLQKGCPCNPTVWIEAGTAWKCSAKAQSSMCKTHPLIGMHAREWISPATTLYLIDQLVEKYDRNPRFADEINIYILPSANPDGYEYSQTEVGCQFCM